MPEPAPKKVNPRKGRRYGHPSWSEFETDRPAPEATDHALGILARWLVRAARAAAPKKSDTPAQNPPPTRLLSPGTCGKRLD